MKNAYSIGAVVCLLALGWAPEAFCMQPVNTEQGVYRLDVEFVANPVTVGLNALTLRLREHDSEKPAKDSVKLEIVPWMPIHEHVAMEMPDIKALGEGVFRVEGLNFSMPGDWEVHIRMDSDGREDSAVFDVKVEP